ncbi:hypothetical protein [Paraburkholderia terricola]|uniref:Uncharacterized protein n=1 Tax=Paraburkholderia terricola TaxID=169427 RepID=A0A1M6JLE3_9BURK|nr:MULTISPECIES: hypothetical protein [Paraburkholderia]SDN63523.1 hypothetical protein SAMN05192547_1002185 [Paraburkholderia sediminicola]SHJ47462.1 hypothetical protein SAMN05192548_1002185 [Paraburkholderia terricola]
MKTAKLDKLREQIAAIKAEIVSVERAQLTTPEIEARVDGFIQEMKRTVANDVLDSAGTLTYINQLGSGAGNWPVVGSWMHARPAIGFAMAVTLNPEAFRAMVLEAALKELNGGRQEHATGRVELVEQLRGKLRLLERDEEAEVLRLEESGIDALRRADADPAVVLGLAA